jgi:hypothetical protein
MNTRSKASNDNDNDIVTKVTKSTNDEEVSTSSDSYEMLASSETIEVTTVKSAGNSRNVCKTNEDKETSYISNESDNEVSFKSDNVESVEKAIRKSNECIGNEIEVEVPDSKNDNDEFSDSVLLNSGKKYRRSQVLLEGSRRLLGDETVVGIRAETKSDAHAPEMHEHAEYRVFQLELESAGIAGQGSGIDSAGSSVDMIPDTENGQTLRFEIDALNYDLKRIRDE